MYLEEYFSNSFCNLFCRFLFKSVLRLLSSFFSTYLTFFLFSITYFSKHLSLFFKFRSPFFCCFFCLLTELNCFWFFIDIFQLDTYTFFLSFLSHPNVYCSNICMTCPPFMPVWRRKKGPRCVLGVGIHSFRSGHNKTKLSLTLPTINLPWKPGKARKWKGGLVVFCEDFGFTLKWGVSSGRSSCYGSALVVAPAVCQLWW